MFLSRSTAYLINENLELTETEDEFQNKAIRSDFKYFKAVNEYVTNRNKIIPESETLFVSQENEFSKTDLIWIESVFNGKDVDEAYSIARELAFDKNWDRALLLSKYILSKTPRHADAEILIGRMYSWQKRYKESETSLKKVIRKYPKYADSYMALLDTYYWANENEKALDLYRLIKKNKIIDKEVILKIKRARIALDKIEISNKETSKPIVNVSYE